MGPIPLCTNSPANEQNFNHDANDGEDNDNYDAIDDKSHSKQRTVRIIMMMMTPLMSRIESIEL